MKNNTIHKLKKIAKMMVVDKISMDEQDSGKLQKYKDQTISDCNVSSDDALKIAYEALLYPKTQKF